jgi:hypothetical protein
MLDPYSEERNERTRVYPDSYAVFLEKKHYPNSNIPTKLSPANSDPDMCSAVSMNYYTVSAVPV